MNFTVEVPDNLIEKLVREQVDAAFRKGDWNNRAGDGRERIREAVDAAVAALDFGPAIQKSLASIAAERIVDEAVDEYLRKAVRAKLKQMRAEDMLPGVERAS